MSSSTVDTLLNTVPRSTVLASVPLSKIKLSCSGSSIESPDAVLAITATNERIFMFILPLNLQNMTRMLFVTNQKCLPFDEHNLDEENYREMCRLKLQLPLAS